MCLHIDAQSGQVQSNRISPGFGNRPRSRSVTTPITCRDSLPWSSSSIEPICEAAVAVGCTRWTLLKDIEIPLAMPSIMTGVNQTILMCLSMVVLASLIGAKGLGQDVLVALQYSAKGQGMLAGLAILFCAMVIDRIVQGQYVQGHYRRTAARHLPGR